MCTYTMVDVRCIGNVVMDFSAACDIGVTSVEVLGACMSGINLWRYKILVWYFGGLYVALHV